MTVAFSILFRFRASDFSNLLQFSVKKKVLSDNLKNAN